VQSFQAKVAELSQERQMELAYRLAKALKEYKVRVRDPNMNRGRVPLSFNPYIEIQWGTLEIRRLIKVSKRHREEIAEIAEHVCRQVAGEEKKRFPRHVVRY
jgi:hypothetical protein